MLWKCATAILIRFEVLFTGALSVAVDKNCFSLESERSFDAK